MWFNILPSLTAVAVIMAVPSVVIAGTHKFWYGNFYQRDLTERVQRVYFLRDERISGKGFNAVGLENLPDEPLAEE